MLAGMINNSRQCPVCANLLAHPILGALPLIGAACKSPGE